MHPFNGYVSNEFSPLQTSLPLSERMAFKPHRQGMVMNSIGENTAVCFEYPSPIIPVPLAVSPVNNIPMQASVIRWPCSDPLGNRQKICPMTGVTSATSSGANVQLRIPVRMPRS